MLINKLFLISFILIFYKNESLFLKNIFNIHKNYIKNNSSNYPLNTENLEDLEKVDYKLFYILLP
jgi:hypothetical protein